MKKLTLLLAMLLAFGLTLGFADEDQLTFELDGSASTTFGINLDENADGNTASGLQNETSFEIDFTIVSEQSAEKGEGDVYGWIQFEDFEVTLDETGDITVTAPDVNAKLVINNIYIDVDGSEDIEVDLASLDAVFLGASIVDADALSGDAYADPAAYWSEIWRPGIEDYEVGMEELEYGDSHFTTSGFVVVGYATDMFDVYAKLGSFNDWFERDAGEAADVEADREHAYAVGFGAEVTAVENLTVNADAILGLNYEDDVPMAFGVSAEYEFALNDMIDLVPFAGADILTMQGTAEDLIIEIGGGVKVLWPGFDDEDENKFSNGLDDDDIVSGASLGVQFMTMADDDDPIMNMIVALYEDAGDESLVPGLGAQVFFEWYDMMKNYDVVAEDQMGFGVYADYAVGDFMPYGKLTYDMYDDDVTLTLGVEASMIPNTTFTLEYYSPRLMDMDETIYGWAAGEEESYKGNVTFAAEISW